MNKRLISEELLVPDSAETISNLFFERGWTDGLPIIPPTEEAVERMLGAANRESREVVAKIPPSWGEATVEKIAINAVMAGCLPEYMPLIITAVAAMCEQQFNLTSIQPTTHPVSPLLIVNGPIIDKLGINGKSGAFGPGWRSNATIGRSIRLILMNIGGAFPGKTDMSTQGQPSKYIFCIAENQEDSPWEPLHVENGFDVSTSTVSVVGVENPHNINDHDALTGEEVLSTIAGTMTTLGNNHVRGQISGDGDAVVALGPEHAATIAKSGFSKKDVRDFLYEHARIPITSFYKRAREKNHPNMSDGALIPPTVLKENLKIIVVGGPGKHSSYLPGHTSHLVVRAIS